MNIFSKALVIAALSVGISANAHDFVPASIAPDAGALGNGQTVVLTYNTYIDWYMHINEYNNGITFEPLNGKATDPISVSSYQGAVINMKTCKVTLRIPETGYEDVTDWALVIPANQIVNPMTNAGNEAMRIEYIANGTSTNPGEDPETPKNMMPVSVTPASGTEVVAPFTQIVIAFPEAAEDIEVNPFNFDDPVDFMNYSFTSPTGQEVSGVQFFTLGNELIFDSFKITEPGEYSLNIKKGFVSSVLGENEPISLSWTVVEKSGNDPEPAKMMPVSVTPASGSEVVAPFTQIVIAFPESAEDIEINPFNLEDLVDFMNYSFTDPTGLEVPDVQFFTLGNELIFDSFNITEPGEYTLILKKGFVSSVLGENQPISLSWKVVEKSGNDPEPAKMMPVSVTPESGSEVVAPFTQVVIAFPEAAEDIEINPFNLDDPFDFMNYTFTGPTGLEVPDVQFFTLGNELIFDSFNITEPGNYTLILKKGFVSSALGENEPINLSWTVVEKGGNDPEPAKMIPASVTPESGTEVVAPFTQIVIVFPESAEDIEVNPFNWDDPFDFMNYTFTGPTGLEVPDVQFFTIGNELIFDSFNITEPGNYTLVLKKGFVSSVLGENETITLTWKVVTENTGIESIDTDTYQSIFFDLNGRRVNCPNPGQPVIKITGKKAVKMIF